MRSNDGTLIEPEKFAQTTAELIERFGGVTQDTVLVIGTWQYSGARYHDDLMRIRIDSSDPVATAFLKGYKELLKERFQQMDIWITAHEIEVL